MSCLYRFLDLDQDFWAWKVVLRQNRDISIVKTSFFLNCQDFLDHEDLLSASVKIQSLNRDTINTNWDPQG